MKEFLEKYIHNIDIKEEISLYKKLPLLYKTKYKMYRIIQGDIQWIALEPKHEIGLVAMRKNRQYVENIAHIHCALFLKRTSFYIREKLIEENIPFVLNNQCILLPFLGYVLPDLSSRYIEPIDQISFLTQKLFIHAIYEKWQSMNVTEIAKHLKVSKKSVSQCFDELEYLNIPVLKMFGKSRVLTIPEDRKKLWNDNIHKLRNPVIKRFVLENDIKASYRGGISALCDYSLLSDNKYPTYVIAKKAIKESGIQNKRKISPLEDIGCIVLEVGYFIDFQEKGLQDPLSVSLSMSEEERYDERIEMSIEEMLEEYVWMNNDK